MSRQALLYILVVLGLGTLLTLPAAGKVQPTTHRAGLVVQFADHHIETACVDFTEDEISGLDLLARSNIPYIAQPSGVGVAICKIGDEGCAYPAQDCFCKCQGAQCIYWAFYLQNGASWAFANTGVANSKVHDGDVQAWVWGSGTIGQSSMPPEIDPSLVCAVPAAGPTSTSVPPTVAPPSPTSAPPRQAIPTPRPRATRPPPPPTATSPPTATLRPTNTPIVASPTSRPPLAPTPLPTAAPSPSPHTEQASSTARPAPTAVPPPKSTATPLAKATPSPVVPTQPALPTRQPQAPATLPVEPATATPLGPPTEQPVAEATIASAEAALANVTMLTTTALSHAGSAVEEAAPTRTVRAASPTPAPRPSVTASPLLAAGAANSTTAGRPPETTAKPASVDPIIVVVLCALLIGIGIKLRRRRIDEHREP